MIKIYLFIQIKKIMSFILIKIYVNMVLEIDHYQIKSVHLSKF